MSVHAFSSSRIQPARCYATAEIPANSICNLAFDGGNSRLAIAVSTSPATAFVRAVHRIPAGTWTTAATLEFIAPVIPCIAGEVLDHEDVGAAMVVAASGRVVKGAGTPTFGKYVPIERGNNTSGDIDVLDTIYVMAHHA